MTIGLLTAALALSGTATASASPSTAPASAAAAASAAVTGTGTMVTLSENSKPAGYQLDPRVRVQVVAGNGSVPRGNLVFKANGSEFGRAKVESNGKAVLPLPARLRLGSYRISVSFLPSSAAYRASSGAATFTVYRATPSLTVSVPQNRPAYGGSAVITVGVRYPGGAVGAGTVTLVESGRVVATAGVSSKGAATIPFTLTMRPGKKYFSARFSGTPSVNAGSQIASFTVSRAASRTVAAAPNGTAGGSVTVRVSVTGTLRTPSGTTAVRVAGGSYVRVLSAGSTSATVPGLPAGSHRMTASYSGDPWYLPSGAISSVFVVANNPCPVSARACVDLTNNLAWIQSGGRVVYGPVPITSGRPGYRTSAGTFAVYWKDKDHLSSIFNNAPMPNSVFFDGGNAFHEGSLYVPSHGCIHLSWEASEYFYNTLNYGDVVAVFGYAPY